MAELLLSWSEGAPHADCQDGMALVSAAANEHDGDMRLPLSCGDGAPRADQDDGIALVEAAR